MGKLYKHDEKTDKEFANLYKMVGTKAAGSGKDGKDGKNGSDGKDGSDGVDGISAYVYVAYASDSIGTGFSLTPNPALDYMAVKSTSVFISSPSASDFTGLWKKIKGEDGINGTNGTNGQGVPAGGTTGQVLTKASSADYDTLWASISGAIIGLSTSLGFNDIGSVPVSNNLISSIVSLT